MSKQTLYLIDGTSLCYRSFFAIRLSTSEGFPTGAIYGFHQILKKIISTYNPSYMGICFDVSRKTFRQKKFKEYKIQRPPLPGGLKVQFPLVKKLISALGIRAIEKEGFEADDIIASFCLDAVRDDLSVVVVTSDKDFCQLMDTDKVSIYNYDKGKFFGRNDFLNKYGFSPNFMSDYLSLTGDSADNIPGAKGIGRVGAAKLIGEFGSLTNIFHNLSKLPQKMQDILVKNKEIIFLSKELVQFYPCNLKMGWQDLKIKEPDSTQIYKIFSELEFKALLKKVPGPSSDFKIEIKEGISQSLLQQLIKEPLTFFSEGEKVFIFDHIQNCIRRIDFGDLKEVFEDSEIKKISYGFKKQLLALKDIGIGIRGVWFDVQIAAYLSDSSLIDYSLSALISHYLRENFSPVSAEFSSYFIYQLYKLLSVKLKEEGLEKLFFEVEMPLIYVLCKMQDDGVKINAQILNDLLEEVDKKGDSIKKKIFEIVGKEFNLNSPKQLRVVLFEELKIKPLKKIKTGYSTNEEVLGRLSSRHPIAGFILEYRQLNKLKTTYIVPLIKEVEKNKGILHTQFNQAVTQTGRLSSSSPNLQSIPAKGEFSSQLRKAFISSFKGGRIFSGDYSQIELRILAHLSGDKKLIEAFNNDLDIHNFTAMLLFGIERKDVNSLQRDLAKRINFSIIYGMSSYGLSKELKITPIEAQNFIDDYFRRYQGVKDYIDRVCAESEKEGYVRTILGRKRKLPGLSASDTQLKEFAFRQAVNAPIQGSCADLIKIAMVRIYQELKEKGLKTKLIMQIHDELIFDVSGEELQAITAIVKNHMEQSMKLVVSLKVNLKAGENWGEMVPVLTR